MVDLHDSLRPTGTTSPLPVSEIAARAKRRGRRRRASATGLAVATLAIGAFAISNIPGQSTDTVTVADGSQPEDLQSDGIQSEDFESEDLQSEDIASEDLQSDDIAGEGDAGEPAEATTQQNDADDADDASTTTQPTSDDSQAPNTLTTSVDGASDSALPEEAAPTEPEPLTTPGILTEITTTSDWDAGYCIQVDASNDDADLETWQVILNLNGTIETIWNATAVEVSDGIYKFSGLEGYNTSIASGATTSFGTCVDTIAD